MSAESGSLLDARCGSTVHATAETVGGDFRCHRERDHEGECAFGWWPRDAFVAALDAAATAYITSGGSIAQLLRVVDELTGRAA